MRFYMVDDHGPQIRSVSGRNPPSWAPELRKPPEEG
jgi:hypothetical protein